LGGGARFIAFGGVPSIPVEKVPERFVGTVD
jgi:hypothetical protein